MLQRKGEKKKLFSPTGFSQISPSVLAVQGLALSPATSALSRYAQKPESLGSPGNHCSVLAVKGDMSSHPQYETFIFLRPTQGVSFCKRENRFVHVFFTHTHTCTIQSSETYSKIPHRTHRNAIQCNTIQSIFQCFYE